MQIIAMITMLIDHIGLVFYPDNPIWRIIGRLAFPIYCYGIVQGIQHTRSRKKYLARLLIIGLIAQLPYSISINALQINVIGTFIVILLVFQLMDRLDNKKKALPLIVGAITLHLLPFEYGAYALMLAAAYRYLSGHRILIAHIVINLAAHLALGWEIQHISILVTAAIVYGQQLLKIINRLQVPRWIWRSYYPAHLAILAAIKLI